MFLSLFSVPSLELATTSCELHQQHSSQVPALQATCPSLASCLKILLPCKHWQNLSLIYEVLPAGGDISCTLCSSLATTPPVEATTRFFFVSRKKSYDYTKPPHPYYHSPQPLLGKTNTQFKDYTLRPLAPGRISPHLATVGLATWTILLRLGLDPCEIFHHPTHGATTLLHEIVRARRDDLLVMALDNPSLDFYITDQTGDTSLHLAASMKDLSASCIMCYLGFSETLLNRKGETPLDKLNAADPDAKHRNTPMLAALFSIPQLLRASRESRPVVPYRNWRKKWHLQKKFILAIQKHFKGKNSNFSVIKELVEAEDDPKRADNQVRRRIRKLRLAPLRRRHPPDTVIFQPKQGGDISLLEALEDPVTKDLLEDCHKVAPCGHNFSKQSIERWKELKEDLCGYSSCPNCRAIILEINPNHPVNSIIKQLEGGLDASLPPSVPLLEPLAASPLFCHAAVSRPNLQSPCNNYKALQKLYRAIRYISQQEFLTMLLDGLHLTHLFPTHPRSPYQCSILHLCVIHKRSDLLSLCIAQIHQQNNSRQMHNQLNTQDSKGKSPLQLAIRFHHMRSAVLLLRTGALPRTNYKRDHQKLLQLFDSIVDSDYEHLDKFLKVFASSLTFAQYRSILRKHRDHPAMQGLLTQGPQLSEQNRVLNTHFLATHHPSCLS